MDLGCDITTIAAFLVVMMATDGLLQLLDHGCGRISAGFLYYVAFPYAVLS